MISSSGNYALDENVLSLLICFPPPATTPVLDFSTKPQINHQYKK